MGQSVHKELERNRDKRIGAEVLSYHRMQGLIKTTNKYHSLKIVEV
jgi:hypothetical protein